MKKDKQAKIADYKNVSERVGDYSSFSDNDLLDRIKHHNDARAFSFIMERYKDKVKGLSYRLLNNNSEGAEDAMQDVFCTVWRTRDKWDIHGTAQFSTWIYRVTVNRCVDMKRKMRPQVNLDDVDLVHDDSAELKMGQVQVAGIVRGLLDELPTSQALALRLYYLEEKTIPEISKEMKKTEQSVRSMIKRGKAGLRENSDVLVGL